MFVCHSKGGLVARWFLEMLGGHDFTRTSITIGTPYRGSINTLNAIVNQFERKTSGKSSPLDGELREGE